MKVLKVWLLVVSLLPIFMIVGCGDGGSSDSGSSGTINLSLTDATTDNYKAVYITVEEVQVHKDGDNEGNWQVVATPNTTYNLLDLVNGVRKTLGVTSLGTGHYTQIRLIIGDTSDDTINLLSENHPYANYVVDGDGSDTCHELKIPSGYQTGVKIVQGFDINEGQTTELILDFDASRSIVRAGNSGQWHLKPTIRILNTEECSLLNGTVNTADGSSGLEGALVSAQIYDSDADDPKDRIVVQTSTITDEDGDYSILLESGAYNIVVYKDGYSPKCANLTAVSGGSHTEEFSLETASNGDMTGNATIQGGSGDQYVTVSVRQTAGCAGNSEDEEIEITSFNVADGTDYSEGLPLGTMYTVVASTYDKTTQEIDNVDVPTQLNIEF